ncbi:Protein ANTAGONIST OF LIKE HETEROCHROMATIN PROTEIN 1, partial [Lucilia cuprina]
LERRWYARPINKDWPSAGYFKKVFKKIKSVDEENFFIHTRMTKNVYELLLSLIKTSLRKPGQRIFPEERLSITLFYLAHGNSIQTIAWSHKLGKTTVRNIILETCEIIWNLLSPIYACEPTTSQYIDIENDFSRMWNIPNCVGAIDGKHIALKCPPNSGSMSFNYKKFFSIVLMGCHLTLRIEFYFLQVHPQRNFNVTAKLTAYTGFRKPNTNQLIHHGTERRD